MVIRDNEKNESKIENIDPRQLRKSVFNGESIDSENSHLFSLSTRQYVIHYFISKRKYSGHILLLNLDEDKTKMQQLEQNNINHRHQKKTSSI